MDISGLRRRIFGLGEDEQPPSPVSGTPHPSSGKDSRKGYFDGADEAVSVSRKKLERLNSYVLEKKPAAGTKRRNFWIFGLGGLFGLVAAAAFATNKEVIDFAHLKDMNLDGLFDVLPAGLVRDAQELQKHERDAVSYDSFAVGLEARSQGISAHHPVIMIPGVISTGLESWATEPDSRQYFRKRLWGSWSMMRALVLDKASWKRHIMLDKYTGLDPPGGIKLRAAQGFDAADFFITGYWIWNKILENLATIGYDPGNAYTAAYDWRLTYSNLEVRDQYFSRLKSHIESAKSISGKKVVLMSHSMGSQVLYYFFRWVEAEGYGNGGSSWVEDFVDSWINVSGCMLGALKDVPAVLSGEMKDTAQLNAFAVYGLEKFLSRHERAEIFRAMFGISSMLPIGGEAVWGNATWAPDDKPGQNRSYGNFITFRSSSTSDNNDFAQNLTVAQSLPYLFNQAEDWYSTAIKTNFSHGVAHTTAEVEENMNLPHKWINPLETRLPHAPSMKIFCFYGYGKPTERAYYYKIDKDPLTKTNVTIDTGYSDSGGDIDHGVVLGEGDGTVNLLSSGYMCAKGWRMKRYNPAGVQITTVEMRHNPDAFSPRGGPNTGDHVDILGRSSLNHLILKIAGGRGHEIEESYTSDILEYAERVRIKDD